MKRIGYTIDRDVDLAASRIQVRLGGVLDQAGCADLRRALSMAPARKRRVNLVIDVGEVTVISSECIDVLLAGYTRALCIGHGYEVVNPHGEVRQALELVRLCVPDEIDLPMCVPPWRTPLDIAPLHGPDAPDRLKRDTPARAAAGGRRGRRPTGPPARRTRTPRRVTLVVKNLDRREIKVTVRDGYTGRRCVLTLRGGQSTARSWNVAPNQGWYNLVVTRDLLHQQHAGHRESGRDSASDPAMGGLA